MVLIKSQTLLIEKIVEWVNDSDECVLCVCAQSGYGKKIVCRTAIKNTPHLKINLYDLVIPGMTSAFDLKENLLTVHEKIKNCNLDIVYIEDINRAINTTTSPKFKHADLSYYFWVEFIESLKNFESIKVIVASSIQTGKEFADEKCWFIEFSPSKEDRWELMERSEKATPSDLEQIYPFVKNLPFRHIHSLIKRTDKLFSSPRGKKRSSSSNSEEIKEKQDWVSIFRYVFTIIHNASLDTRQVALPNPDLELVGMGEIVQEIERCIIHPIKAQNSFIPICRGVLLYGPPGVGKSTIGRWLSHRLEGKVYLAESGPNESLIDSIGKNLRIAARNSPSIVFIDDIDSMMSSPSHVRKLLVLLDGINIKGRENVCVVATGMDISGISSALLRGGRLEKCIRFDYPGLNGCKIIIKNRIENVIDGLRSEEKIELLRVSERLKEVDIDRVAALLEGYSPSNIHLIISSVVRHLYSNPNVSLNDVFSKEAKEVKTTTSISAACALRHNVGTNELSYIN